jgi:hypothetical protein
MSWITVITMPGPMPRAVKGLTGFVLRDIIVARRKRRHAARADAHTAAGLIIESACYEATTQISVAALLWLPCPPIRFIQRRGTTSGLSRLVKAGPSTR